MHRDTLFYFIIILIIKQSSLCSQEIENNSLDTLVTLEFEEIENKIRNTFINNPNDSERYAKAYLQKGKNNKDSIKQAKGFSFLASVNVSDYKKRITYIDSGIALTQNQNHEKYPALLYLSKGAIYEKHGISNKALDCFLEGLIYSKKVNNDKYVDISQHNIAVLKRKFGKYEEAKSIFKKSLSYQKSIFNNKKEYTNGYLRTLSELIHTYWQNKEIDSALIFNNQGFNLSKEKNIRCLFILHKGIIQYHKHEYKNAIDNINKALQELSKKENKFYSENYNVIKGYFFLGKSYSALSNKEMAITYFKKIDSIAKHANYLNSQTRMAHIELINYYKSLDDKKKQLFYINRVLHTDSIINNNFKYVTNKLTKEYDTPILLEKKEKLITDLQSRNNQSNFSLIILIIIIFIIIVFFVIHYRKNKKYRKRFDALINSTIEKSSSKKSVVTTIETEVSIGIAPKVIETILKRLEEFERNNEFIETNITSARLAKKMNTNPKYLTKVIKFYRHKSFSPYINDLRIEYIVDQLKTDKKLQNYTIKAIAKEAGFNSTEVFSKYFFKKTGIYPSYFIKEIQLNDN